MCFSKKLKRLRTEKELTQKELSNELKRLYGIDFSNRVISYYEREESGASIPDYLIVEALANYFNVSTSYLLGIKGKSQEEEIVQMLIEKTDNNSILWHKANEPDPNSCSLNMDEAIEKSFSLSKFLDEVNKKTLLLSDNLYCSRIGHNFYVLAYLDNHVELYYVNNDLDLDQDAHLKNKYYVMEIGDSKNIPLIYDLFESATIDDNKKNRTSKLKSLLDELNNID